MTKLIAIAAMALSLVGCATVNMGDANQDAALKKFTVSSSKSAVYIYRNESMGAAAKMDVELDGKPIGQTAAKTYLYTEVPLGKHTITWKAENVSSLDIDAKPGSLLYIWQEVKMGLIGPRSNLQLVDSAQGKKGVLESKLAETKGVISPKIQGAIGGVSATAGANGVAKIEDVHLVPYLTAAGRKGYEEWLKAPMPKAFALAPSGHYGWSFGAVPKDPSLPIDVAQRALVNCNKNAPAPCKLYAVGNDVVYTRD